MLSLVNKIGKDIYEKSVQQTTTGNWNTYYDEIEKKYDVSESWIDTHRYDIQAVIYEAGGDNVLEIDEYDPKEKCFSVTVGADCVCEKCVRTRDYNNLECRNCDVMMGLWEE